MNKVIYSITQIGKKENTKTTGVGVTNDKDLIVACISAKGKPYIRVFEDALKYCHRIGDTDAFKGCYTEIVETEDRTIEVDYIIWYKKAE